MKYIARLIPVAGALVGLGLSLWTEPLTAADPPSMPPSAPILYSALPAGVVRGESVEMTLSGVYLEPITDVRVAGAGVTAEIVPPAKGRKPNHRRVVVRLTAAADAEPGMRELRVVTAGGASNTLRFYVSPIPEIAEKEPNEKGAQATPLPHLPIVVDGQLNRGEDRDCFRFSAKAGQKLVLDLFARRLHPYVSSQRPGWLEGLITIWHAEDADRVSKRPVAYAHDFGGRQDPLLVFQVPRDGDYVVEIRDELFRGRAQFYYRLAIGELPYVMAAFPAGGRRGSTVPVALRGVNLPDNLTVQVTVPDGQVIDPFWREVVSTKRGWTNEIILHAGDWPEAVEKEPNDASDQATAVSLPATINGVIEREGDFDSFRFTAKKGERWIFETVAQGLTSPLDARLDLYDAKGRRLKASDDWKGTFDARIDHTFAADGEYTIRVGDQTGLGSPRHVYRLVARPLTPDFRLTVSPDNPRVAAGGAVALRVLVDRIDGFNSDIQLSVEGAPKGAKIHSGVLGGTVGEQTVVIEVPADAKPSLVPIRVIGKAKVGDRELVRPAVPSEQIRYINTWKYVPAEDMMLAIVAPAPLTLHWAKPKIVIHGNQKLEVPVRVERAPGYEGAVRMTVQGLPPRVASPPLTLDGKTTEGKLEIRAYGKAPVNTADVVLVTTIRYQGRTHVQYSPPLRVEVVEEPKPKPKPKPAAKPKAKSAPKKKVKEKAKAKSKEKPKAKKKAKK